jgi:hypothetical protein
MMQPFLQPGSLWRSALAPNDANGDQDIFEVDRTCRAYLLRVQR